MSSRMGIIPAPAAPPVPTPSEIFGSGADGALSTVGDVTLTKNMEYTELTVNAGDTLTTKGFHIRVSGTLTVASGGVITDDTGGAAGTAGTGGLADDTSQGDDGTNGGAGGAASVVTSGAGGQGGGGGGAGGCRSQSGTQGDGGDGGVGGKGGGTVIIFCAILDNSDTIHADGVAGAAGSNGLDTGANNDVSGGGGGGGGSGGDGGVCEVYYGTLTNLGTITATPGALGAGGNGEIHIAGGGDTAYNGGWGGNPNRGNRGTAVGPTAGGPGGENGGGGGGGYFNEATDGGDGGDGAVGAAGTLVVAHLV